MRLLHPLLAFVSGKRYDEKVDIFSFGIVLCEVRTNNWLQIMFNLHLCRRIRNHSFETFYVAGGRCFPLITVQCKNLFADLKLIRCDRQPFTLDIMAHGKTVMSRPEIRPPTNCQMTSRFVFLTTYVVCECDASKDLVRTVMDPSS